MTYDHKPVWFYGKNIAGINVADGKSITASTWDESVDVSREHKGLWLNLDSKLNSNGINLQNVSIQLPLRQIDLNTVNSQRKILIIPKNP